MIAFTETPNSSQIAAHAYDGVAQHLHVKFRSGGHYVYKAVPPEAAEQFAQAESIGKHLYAHIRGKFEYERQPEAPPDEATEATTTDGNTVDFRTPWPTPGAA